MSWNFSANYFLFGNLSKVFLSVQTPTCQEKNLRSSLSVSSKIPFYHFTLLFFEKLLFLFKIVNLNGKQTQKVKFFFYVKSSHVNVLDIFYLFLLPGCTTKRPPKLKSNGRLNTIFQTFSPPKAVIYTKLLLFVGVNYCFWGKYKNPFSHHQRVFERATFQFWSLCSTTRE